MSDINFALTESRKPGVKRLKKHNLKIDMTPMVDLGFLLISFFVITTELSRPKAMDLYMPADGLPTASPESKTITFLAGANNKLFYYYGVEKDAGIQNPIIKISWNEKSGIGKVISEKQLQLDQIKGGRSDMVVIIKAGNESTYKNIVDILDEMIIHDVKSYAIVKPGNNDMLYLEKNR